MNLSSVVTDFVFAFGNLDEYFKSSQRIIKLISFFLYAYY